MADNIPLCMSIVSIALMLIINDLVNSKDPEEMQQTAVFHQVLYCLL